MLFMPTLVKGLGSQLLPSPFLFVLVPISTWRDNEYLLDHNLIYVTDFHFR
jgi:hypothetical protein